MAKVRSDKRTQAQAQALRTAWHRTVPDRRHCARASVSRATYYLQGHIICRATYHLQGHLPSAGNGFEWSCCPFVVLLSGAPAVLDTIQTPNPDQTQIAP